MTNPSIRSVELLLAPMAQNWLTERVIANPLSIYPEYAERRSSWYRTMSAGVVRIEEDTSDAELDRFHQVGVRALRLDLFARAAWPTNDVIAFVNG